ncbi:MAG: hypothetical protein N4A45_00040 [Flavobacteriales bacterium]|jgi:hypothetical protein|nr:hypothetical protein [Flavobacteriales bacterium]
MDVGPGHWVFAAIFAVSFIGFLIWAYRKDLKRHKKYYSGSSVFILSIVVLMFLIWVFRDQLQ